MTSAELATGWGRAPRRAAQRNAALRPAPAVHRVAPATVVLPDEPAAPYRIWLTLALLVAAVHWGGAALLSGQKAPPPAIVPAKVPPIRIELAKPLPQAAKPLPQPAKPPVPRPPVPQARPQPQVAKAAVVTPQARPVAVPNTTAAAPAADTVAVSREPAPAAAPAAAAETVTEANGSTAYLHNPAPDYPPMAMSQGWEEKVLLRVFVLANGSADRIEIKQSSGRKMLDEAAIKAVKRWAFVPGKRGSAPVDSWAIVPIEFKLAN
ncbi:energy transducer TonB [Jeongeupia chitinilytica]|uniref:TonB C-terminal domain-containing protein n=1 Tax=Jeongeupia chitinilytica TaxID=1041641 RepID=A0ABQ3H428_9NEIS|nr:energy transducer TonB [Jeongeupia chitinilytica]GHD63930.1 hypothetical protein GCM10007350_22360 [Jeongeupia chitinilytica]